MLHLEALWTDGTWATSSTAWSSGCPTRSATALVERAEGIPLFAVETVRSLIDRDLVVPRGGQYVLADADRLDLDAIGCAGVAAGPDRGPARHALPDQSGASSTGPA